MSTQARASVTVSVRSHARELREVQDEFALLEINELARALPPTIFGQNMTKG